MLKKSVLLTRSMEDNYDIIRAIENNNFSFRKYQHKTNAFEQKFKYICSPLVQYTGLRFNPVILLNYQHIILTSKFATNIFVSGRNNYPHINPHIWVVGNSSNIILTQQNCPVSYIARNIQDLLEHFPQEFYKQTIYLSSNEITQELPPEIRRQIVYQVQYVSQLCHLEDIKQGLDYILLYSSNSAKTLIKLFTENNLLELLSTTQVITISKKVADIIKIFNRNVVYCEDGKPEQMLSKFKSY